MSEPRKDIRVPPAQIWREFRMRYLPIAVFACALVATVYLWRVTVVGPTMVGEVESIQTVVTAPEAGMVTNVFVRRFQAVKAGDPVAAVMSTDARMISGHVQDLRSRIAMSQLEINSMMDRERIGFDYQALNMNTLRFRSDLAAARAELPTLEAAVARAERGWKDKVVPYNDYEESLRLRDSVKARITELEKLVTEAEAGLRQAGAAAGSFTNLAAPRTFQDAMGRLTEERQDVEDVRRKPLILRAPIDGTVGVIARQAGENVMAGDMILTIHALNSERIVTYVRQGSGLEPKKGMAVEVRCRSARREQAMAKIEEVGQRYEAITNVMLLRAGAMVEIGLPVSIEVPTSLRMVLKPGEIVDLGMPH